MVPNTVTMTLTATVMVTVTVAMTREEHDDGESVVRRLRLKLTGSYPVRGKARNRGADVDELESESRRCLVFLHTCCF